MYQAFDVASTPGEARAKTHATRANAKPIDSFLFSTKAFCAAERFAAWRSAYASVLDLSRAEDGEDFAGRHAVWDLGTMAFQTIEADGLAFSSLAEQGRRDLLDHWVVCLIGQGQCVIEGQHERFASVPGAPQIISIAEAFHGRATRGKVFALYIPRDMCRQAAHQLDGAAFSPLIGGMGAIFADYMLSLERRLPQLLQSDLGDLQAATRSLLLAMVAPSSERLDEAGAVISGVLLERAKRTVQENLGNPALDVNFVVKSLGVSRSRLYRLFEASGGIMHYIKRRRLLAAHAMLADIATGQRVFEIAEFFCFNDAAEFSRAFRHEFGYSPSSARGDGRSSLVVGQSATSSDLASLLRRLEG